MYRFLRLGVLAALIVNLSISSFTPRCPAGKGWNGSGCLFCGAGTYSDAVTVDTCTSCPVNTYSADKASYCSNCTAGSDTRAQTRQYTCKICPIGYANPTPGQSCTQCKPGTSAQNQGSQTCDICGPGTYAANAGANSCSMCQAGDYNPSMGQAGCMICAKGYYSAMGSIACTMCPCGTFNPTERQSGCQNCTTQNGMIRPSPPGSTSSGQCLDYTSNGGSYYDAKKCPIKCPGGTYSTTIQSGSCTSCPPRQVSPVGSTSQTQCTTCPGTSMPNLDRSACLPTPSGGPMYQPMRRKNLICPRGLAACPVQRRGRTKEDSTTMFECIDILNDVESCGGCPLEGAAQGEDCSAFDERATARCVEGVCKYECPMGWKAGKKGCVRTPKGQRITSGRKKRSGRSEAGL